jgi:hypothetical protein
MKGFLAFGARDTGVSGRVAIVGFADNRTPEADRSKLAGRVAVMFAGSRTGVMPPTPSRRGLFRGARRDSGVVATLIVLDDTGAFSYDRMISQLSASGLVRGRMTLKGEVPRQTRTTPLFFFVSPKAAKAILASTGISLAQAREYAARDSIFAPMLLDDVTVDVRTKTTREDRQAENVVGLLEGSDPGLKKEVVVFSAHFDHLGVDPSGAIYHGADDNGSGTAMVIELARAFSKNPVRPKCSLLFLCVSGEEKGLLGSSYYTSHPVIPLDRTVADFNTDMIGRMDSTHEREHSGVYTYLIGSDKISTELDSILRVANKESDNIGLDYKYDDEHDLNEFYRRSDHYNFARRGVPIAFFFTGVHADYHRPTDTVDKILFDRIVKIGQVVYYAGWKTANITHMLVKNGTRNGYRDSPQIPGAE